jgi:hypothetical protein
MTFVRKIRTFNVDEIDGSTLSYRENFTHAQEHARTHTHTLPHYTHSHTHIRARLCEIILSTLCITLFLVCLFTLLKPESFFEAAWSVLNIDLSLKANQGSILPTFLCVQIPKAQKDTDDLTIFCAFGIFAHKNCA